MTQSTRLHREWLILVRELHHVPRPGAQISEIPDATPHAWEEHQ